jgi:hypothetical protein
MPKKRTLDRARQDRREGKAPSTQAGEFVREQIEHIREGKHGARSAKQAIAIGLSQARRAGVKRRLPRRTAALRMHAQRVNARLRQRKPPGRRVPPSVRPQHERPHTPAKCTRGKLTGLDCLAASLSRLGVHHMTESWRHTSFFCHLSKR